MKSLQLPTRFIARAVRHQRGVGLVEILVAVLLLSIGFLAAAQMQMQGMRFSQSAYLQSQAYFMISDMMDRMRSNVPGVLAGGYNNKSTSASASNPNCSSNFCDASSMATQDLFDWSAHLHNLRGDSSFVSLLPGTATTPALGEIIQRANGVYTVQVSWNEKIGGSDQVQTLRLDFVPWL